MEGEEGVEGGCTSFLEGLMRLRELKSTVLRRAGEACGSVGEVGRPMAPADLET